MIFWKKLLKRKTSGLSHYFDTAATTPLSQEAKREFLKASDLFGNPGSLHHEGEKAAAYIDSNIKKIAKYLHARDSEITFTRGGTEACALIVSGIIQQSREHVDFPHVIMGAYEHSAVAMLLKTLELAGEIQLDVCPLLFDGSPDFKALSDMITEDTALVTHMLVQNETGFVFDVKELAKYVRRAKKRIGSDTYPLIHTDAIQATAYFDIDVRKLGVDALSLSGSKCFGPKSSGIAWVRAGTQIDPLWFVSGTKFPLRPGTEDVMSIGPCVSAYSAVASCRKEFFEKATMLQEYFESGLGLVSEDLKDFDITITKNTLPRSPHISHLTFKEATGERVVIELSAKGFAVSSRSACGSSESETLSGSLITYFEAIGVLDFEDRGSLRVSFGPWHAKKDIDMLLSALHGIFLKIKEEQVILSISKKTE